MSIQNLLRDSFKKYKNNNAIMVHDKYYTYDELYKSANNICNCILEISRDNLYSQPVAIMGTRSFFTYSGICAAVLSGCYYLPLNEIFPKERIISMLEQSETKIIILDTKDFDIWESILESISGYHIIINDGDLEQLSSMYNNTFYKAELYKDSNVIPYEAKEDDYLYVLFTSGSTGVPKSIYINQINFESYIIAFLHRHTVSDRDRFVQMADLTFDLSVHSIFLTFLHGACLYVVDKFSKLNPGLFISKYEITHAIFVPSVLNIMKKLNFLRKDSLPSLKYVSIVGEPLPIHNALLFAEAAPNAVCENTYGPTETTVTCTFFVCTPSFQEKEEHRGVMPLGTTTYNMEIILVNQDLYGDGVGEIAIHGPQVFNGYKHDPALTQEKIVYIDNKRFYLTGDLGKILDGELIFLGRNDMQVQINGYRVELYDIEYKMKNMKGILDVVALPVSTDGIINSSLTLFVKSKSITNTDDVKEYAKEHLPLYMVPKHIVIMEDFPFNSNGKVDRKYLRTLL